MTNKIKTTLITFLPSSIINILGFFLSKQGGFRSTLDFIGDNKLNISVIEKLGIIKQMCIINNNVETPHTHYEMLSVIRTILSNPSKGVIAEAGCFKGGSSSKISLAADIIGRDFVIFDSFEGIPDNEEEHDKNIFGGSAGFAKGDYSGSLNEVKSNIEKYGRIKNCRFVKGWFDDTLPSFNECISTVYVDVDLVSSTKTCLKYFYPLLDKGGVFYSQDGHLPLVINLFNDENFWKEEIGIEKPLIEGLGRDKLLKIIK